jgi:hypothetical protein
LIRTQEYPPAVGDPQQRARLLAALYIAQEQFGWLSPEAIQRVADRLELSPGQVKSTASFYTMFKLAPKGKYLVSNAIKYTPANGYINIKLDAGPEDITGEISDTGIGIPEEDQARLFSEFFRAKNAKTLEIPGTGLGLAIVKRILDGLNGSIEVESRVDWGATFRFKIPITQITSFPEDKRQP